MCGRDGMHVYEYVHLMLKGACTLRPHGPPVLHEQVRHELQILVSRIVRDLRGQLRAHDD